MNSIILKHYEVLTARLERALALSTVLSATNALNSVMASAQAEIDGITEEQNRVLGETEAPQITVETVGVRDGYVQGGCVWDDGEWKCVQKYIDHNIRVFVDNFKKLKNAEDERDEAKDILEGVVKTNELLGQELDVAKGEVNRLSSLLENETEKAEYKQAAETLQKERDEAIGEAERLQKHLTRVTLERDGLKKAAADLQTSLDDAHRREQKHIDVKEKAKDEVQLLTGEQKAANSLIKKLYVALEVAQSLHNRLAPVGETNPFDVYFEGS